VIIPGAYIGFFVNLSFYAKCGALAAFPLLGYGVDKATNALLDNTSRKLCT